MDKFWWAGWDYGIVQHAWRSHRFNPYYVSSACGHTAVWEKVTPNLKRHCKNCERVIKSRSVNNG